MTFSDFEEVWLLRIMLTSLVKGRHAQPSRIDSKVTMGFTR